MKILIRNGRVIEPASGRDESADLAIAAGRIVAIGHVPNDFTPDRTIDAQGCVVAPGLVDLAARLKEAGPGRWRASWRRRRRAASPASCARPTPTRRWTSRAWWTCSSSAPAS